MSTSQRSYYEIALTNRQVLIAFSILLGCVVSAFVSGLWVGRQAAARTLASTEVAGPGDSTAPGTYRFFAEDSTAVSEEPSAQQAVGASPAPAPPPQSAATEPTPAESVVARPDQPRPPTPEPPAVTARREPETAASTRPVVPAPSEEPGQANTAVASPPPDEQAEAREPERRRVVDPPATSELAVIQVFSTAEEAQARAVLDRLKSGGFRAFLSPVQVDGRTMYRVRVGPFRERAAAEVEAAKLKQLYKLDTWITN